MNRPLDLARLHELCGRPLPGPGDGAAAFSALDEMGAIGRLWLRPEIINRARAWQQEWHGPSAGGASPVTPAVQAGEIGILLATENAAGVPWLRPAFVLPVEWRDGGEHSRLLPAGLAGLAEEVLADLGLSGLSLHLAKWLEHAGADFSALPVSDDSAWAALAVGAIVAAEKGSTLPGVLVSAAWRRQQDPRQGAIRTVGMIGEKLAAAAGGGARMVFLPEGNRDDAEGLPADHPGRALEVNFLAQMAGAPRRAIAAVLQAVEAVPRREALADFERRCRYYIRAARDRQNAYYCDELLEEIARGLHETIVARGLDGVDGLALIASESWSLACLLAATFPGADVLLLHDHDLKNRIEDIKERLRTIARPRLGERVVQVTECRTGEGFAEDATRALGAFAAGRSRLVVDMTGGYRHYMFSLLDALPSNAVATCIATEFDKEQKVFLPHKAKIHVLDFAGRTAS